MAVTIPHISQDTRLSDFPNLYNALADVVNAGGGGGVSDHGALTGLGDDDHTQYRLEADDKRTESFTLPGTATTGVGATRWYNDTGRTITILWARATVGTAPTGQSLIVDVNNNGSSLWGATQANRPTIAAGTNTNKRTTFDDASIADGEYITVDVDQVGSGTAGADLVVTVGWQ